jgi:hypothetical protein
VKIVLSRKGSDSEVLGIPSPILPDGQLLSLPISDNHSRISYKDIRVPIPQYRNLWEVIRDLGGTSIAEKQGAHLDPDIRRDAIPRVPEWRPLFGQVKGARSHLLNCGVDRGSIFLFFGWFHRTVWESGRLAFDRTAPDVHVLFGYLYVGDILSLPGGVAPEYEWTRYHPHYSVETLATSIFVADRYVEFAERRFPGAGCFKWYSESLCLTKPSSPSRSLWRLPKWFYPFDNGRRPLTYHDDRTRWKLTDDCAELRSVGRGQEFVFCHEEYPESKAWVESLLDNNEVRS